MLHRFVRLLLTLAMTFAAPLAPIAEGCCEAGATLAAAQPHLPAHCCCPDDTSCCCVNHAPGESAPAPHDQAPPSDPRQQIPLSVFAPTAIAVLVADPPVLPSAPSAVLDGVGFLASRPALRRHLQLSILRD